MPPLSPLAARVHVGAARPGASTRGRSRGVRAGDDVIVLSIGDPDFDTPAPIVDAAVASLRGGRTHYTAARGERELLAAIAERTTRQTGVRVGASGRLPARRPGGAVRRDGVRRGRGRRGRVPEPAYATYEGVVAAVGARMVHVPLPPSATSTCASTTSPPR